MNLELNVAMKAIMRVPYALRHRVPEASLCFLLPSSGSPQAGDIALAKIDKIGRMQTWNFLTAVVARCMRDALAVVFGNRYATMQFEGYARVDEDLCDLLSMGGVCAAS